MPLLNKPEETRDSPSEQRKACRNRAMDLLARREHSRLELERKLLARSYSQAPIDQVLDALESEGLLAEGRFVESFIRSRVSKGQGPTRIRAELLQRGIEESAAQAGLQEANLDWASLAAQAWQKRFGPHAPGDFKERARQARFLQYRGFEMEQINAALDVAADSD